MVYQAPQQPMVVAAPQAAAPRPAALSTAGLAGKLFISNLDSGVTTDDIEVRINICLPLIAPWHFRKHSLPLPWLGQELFSKFGDTKSAGVHFDPNGQSLGTAQVTYKKKKSAEDAHEQYNGVALDGTTLFPHTWLQLPLRFSAYLVVGHSHDRQTNEDRVHHSRAGGSGAG